MTIKKHTTQPIEWKSAMTLLDAMANKPKEANARLMIAIGFYVGLRIGDILQLKWSNIEGDDITIKEQKTNKVRTMQVSKPLRRIIDSTIAVMNIKPQPSDYIFTIQKVVRDSNKPISVTAANKRIKSTFEKYNIKVANPSSHTLRKTFALGIYDLYGRCDDALVLLAEMLNHANTTVTRKYLGITARRIADAYTALALGKPQFDEIEKG